MISFFLHTRRAQLLTMDNLSIIPVALLDWRVELNVSSGFLYFFPMLTAESFEQWQNPPLQRVLK
jgi:hypothetical protein